MHCKISSIDSIFFFHHFTLFSLVSTKCLFLKNKIFFSFFLQKKYDRNNDKVAIKRKCTIFHGYSILISFSSTYACTWRVQCIHFYYSFLVSWLLITAHYITMLFHPKNRHNREFSHEHKKKYPIILRI